MALPQPGQKRLNSSYLEVPLDRPDYSEILEFIHHELSVGRADLEERLCQATTSAEYLATENERQAVLIDEQLATIESLRGETAALAGRLAEIETAIGTHREDAARERQAAEAARTEVAKLMLRLEGLPRLEAELAELRKECLLIDRSRQEVAKELAVSSAAYQSLELSKNEAVTSFQSRLSDVQEELRVVSAQLQAAQTERFQAAAELASAHAMRAEEG